VRFVVCVVTKVNLQRRDEKIASMPQSSIGTIITIITLLVLLSYVYSQQRKVDSRTIPSCQQLHSSQYNCQMPNISKETFEYENCPKARKLQIQCSPIYGVNCTNDDDEFEDNTMIFTKEIDCYHTNGHSFFVAMALSVFFGILGFDRMYLGYWGLGIFKLFTIGGFGIWAIVDCFLISMQHLGPADGSNYIVGYNGPRTSHFPRSSDTLFISWFHRNQG
jgi:TM2 domain-containing membrane protein YozV